MALSDRQPVVLVDVYNHAHHFNSGRATLVTSAVKSFKQSVWGAMTGWMTNVAAAEKAADNSAGAVKSYETSLFAEVHDLGDDFATAADDFVDNVLGDWLPYAQNVASAVAGAAHGGVSALDTLLSSLRTAGTTQAQDDRASWTSYKLGIVGNEDGLMSGVPPIVGPGVMRV